MHCLQNAKRKGRPKAAPMRHSFVQGGAVRPRIGPVPVGL
jgi:hypothetical protein